MKAMHEDDEVRCCMLCWSELGAKVTPGEISDSAGYLIVCSTARFSR